MAHVLAPIHLSPSPLKALRERGTKGERVPFPSPYPNNALPTSPNPFKSKGG